MKAKIRELCREYAESTEGADELEQELLDLYLVMLSESEGVIKKESEDLGMQEDEEYVRGFRCGHSRMIGIIEEKLHSA